MKKNNKSNWVCVTLMYWCNIPQFKRQFKRQFSPLKYIIHYIIYFKIQECLGIVNIKKIDLKYIIYYYITTTKNG